MSAPDKADVATGKVELTAGKNRLAIKFTYDPVVIARVKTLSERQWHSADKRWTAALTVGNVDKLRDWGFAVSKEVAEFAGIENRRRSMPHLDFGELNDVLDDYQKDGVRRAEYFDGRVLFADDPGLGKTPQCLAWLRLHHEARPAVIVPKKTGKLVWQRMAKRGILTDSGTYVPLLPDDRVQIIYGEQDVDIDADVIIANYDILARVVPCEACGGVGEFENGMECRRCKGSSRMVTLRPDLAAIRQKVTILDEPQMISNPKAQRTIACRQLCSGSSFLLTATASPIKRRPKQFFNILNMLRADLFPSFWKFGQRYCDAKHNGFGWNFDGASNLDELNDILISNLMIRRTTREVLGDLPINRQVVPLDIKNRGEYEAAEEDFLGWLQRRGKVEELKAAEKAEALVRITKLLGMAAERKIHGVLDWLHEWFETNDGKIIVFVMHTAVLNKIIDEFPEFKPQRIEGGQSEKQRQRAEIEFQEDPDCRLIVCQSDAGGDTWTGSAAYDVAFAELPRTSEDVKQNEGRAYGRRNNPHGINSWFLVAADTYEERRAEQLNEGARVVGATLDGRPMDADNDLIKLIGRTI